ncbi:nuclear transport factor 2 family protein [Undibacterium sp.]|uniref:nuclear transport factor 2 family protein n=1 Tax=Undibacterium sp. TaxID=1914977 RepID=UPI00374DAFAF
MTTIHTAPDAAHIAAAYLAAWNELDAVRRRKLISGIFTADAAYTDPMARSSGHEALDTLIAAVQQKFAGLRFRLHGRQDGHNDVIRFCWALAADGAEPVAYGTDVATIAADGRICSVTGFLDAMAA